MIPKVIFSEGKKDWVKRPLLSNIDKILDYRGRTPKKLGLSWSDTGYLALSALNVKNGYIDFNADANYGDQELYDRWMGDNHLHKGQVVFTTEAPMGNVAQLPNDDLYILSQRTIAFEVKHDLIREDFLATLLRSPKIFNELTSLSSGGTAKGVSQKSLSNLKVCVPTSLEEQSAIGSLFRTLDDLLASYKDNLANYQSLKVTMLSKMFPKARQTVPEIRLDGFEGEWKKDTLEPYLTESRISGDTGLTAKKITVKLWGKGVIEKEEKYAGSSNTQYFIRKAGQFIYSKLDFQNQAFGIIPNELDGYQSTLDLPTFDIQNIDPKFLLEYVMRRDFYEYQGLIANGSRKAKRIHPEDFLVMPVRIPSLEEQQTIGTYFSNLDNLIASHQEKISQLETLKKKLLQDMFI
ncbi:restriction endonuclease subunit S [Streptococcus rubneri]|uniref:restriction endonuclease subunit S n=1 Tax=Streptococcus rubneri TaxID=1234680 RepID=UPI001C591E57|nr:restriction endonuclease subunit S [Streptococcus rubneri]QXW96168.1 restriction endonuclease subunit S [Streptococcus rubneri]